MESLTDLENQQLHEIQIIKGLIYNINSEDVCINDVINEKGVGFALQSMKQLYFRVCNMYDKIPNQKFMIQSDIDAVNSPYYGE